MTAALVQANALALPLADESVDLVVTSPPYFGLRSYRDDDVHVAEQIGAEATPAEFVAALLAATAECVRVLKPTGSIFVNLGDKYAGSRGTSGASTHYNSSSKADQRVGTFEFGGVRPKSLIGIPWRFAIGAIDELGLILRAEIVWRKPNGLPESATDRVRRNHETWFHFTKSGDYFAAVDELRPPKADGSGDLGRVPESVWSINLEPMRVPTWVGVDHFAAFPTEWPRRLILGWSPAGVCTACHAGRRPDVVRTFTGTPDLAEGRRQEQWSPISGGWQNVTLGHEDEVHRRIAGYRCDCDVPTAPTTPAVVLDPFGGTGTTAMVARALGRFGVSVDLSADYVKLARWRIFTSGHGQRAEQRTHRERQGTLPV